MKRSYFLLVCIVSCLLFACSRKEATKSDSANSVDFNEISASSTSSSESDSSPSSEFSFYQSIYEVPNVKLDYDGSSSSIYFRCDLTKDGSPWIGAPGYDKFGDLCFSDGENFYIQCFLSTGDGQLLTDFRWFCVNFNHFDDKGVPFLPDETMNKVFIRAENDTLYTEDGYQYTLHTSPDCKDGTCKK